MENSTTIISAQTSASGRKSLKSSSEKGTVMDVDLADDLSPYSAVRAALAVIAEECPEYKSDVTRELRKLDLVLKREASDYGFGTKSTDGSSVAFAVLRRVSRESVYTARYIDSFATTVAKYIGRLAGEGAVTITGLSGVDRLSAKTLVRAVAKLPKNIASRVTIFESGAGQGDAQSLSRENMIKRMSTKLIGKELQIGLTRTDSLSGSDIVEIAQNIVLQNFDRRITNAQDDPEVYRLQAIAQVNTGQYDEALALLDHARNFSDRETYKAHLDYLSGLVTRSDFMIRLDRRPFSTVALVGSLLCRMLLAPPWNMPG